MKKILFIQEYVRMDHVVTHKDGTASIQFKQSRSGQKLKEKLGRIGLNTRDYDVAYMYPKVPEVNKVGFDGKPISYKDPKSTELKPYQSEIAKTIVDGEYDIVIPMGKIGCKYLLGAASITKLRGVPERVTLETEEGNSHEFWTLPMFSMEYVSAAPNVDGLQEADITTLGKYIVQGDKAFLPNIVDYEYVTSMDRVDEIFSFLKETKPVTAWDLETNTLKSDLPGAKPLVITLAWEEGQGVTIPWDHKDTPFSEADRERITQHTKELLADAATPKVGHHTQYDIHFLMSTKGLTEFESCRDTKIGYYLSVTQEAEDSFRLSDLAYEMTDMGGYDKPLEEWRDNFIKEHARDKEKPVNEVDGSNFNYEWIPLELLHPYAAGDVDCCLRIHNKLYEHIKQDPEWELLFTNWYPALTRTLARIESNGFKVDIDYLNMIDEKYEEEEARVLEEIREFPGVKELEAQHQALYDMGLQEKAKPVSERDKEIANLTKYKDKLAFNPNSAQDKGRVLYQILNIQLPATKETLKPAGMNKQEKDLTWEDYKTDKFAMNYIVDNVPEHKDLAAKLLEHSSVKTLRNNFTKKLPKMVSPKTGRVHANYNSTGTATSRLSSNSPNQQQLPSGSHNVDKFDYHYPVKRAFVSAFEKGGIIQLDYSALEMRILGLRTMDPAMTKAYLDGEDIHKSTAALAFNTTYDEVTKDQRQAAKAVSFGLIYGKSTASQAMELNISLAEAEDIVNKYFSTKPTVKQFIEDTHLSLEKNGFVSTMQGHKRQLKGIWTKDKRSDALRQSVNTIN